MELQWFKPEEFEKCVPSCKMEQCDEVALQRLDRLRSLCGFPIKLNSAYRSPEFDKSKNRSGNSAHCRGLAFDVSCRNAGQRAYIVATAQKVGFLRIGIGATFVHLDCDYSKPYPRIWLY